MRKQVYDLSISDFRSSLVWEFALDEEGKDGQDEATVRPFNHDGKLDASGGMYVVRASFLLADGTKLQGFLTPPVHGDHSLGTIQPTIITGNGHIGFWCGVVEPNKAEISKLYRWLGKSSSTEVFPVKFASDVCLVGGLVDDVIPGFLVIKGVRTQKIKIVT